MTGGWDVRACEKNETKKFLGGGIRALEEAYKSARGNEGQIEE